MASADNPLGASDAERGFSLVELLVVIGIIAILIGLLLPALASLRARGEEIRCQAALRAIGQAAQLHINDHGGYLPIAGWHWGPSGGLCNPRGLGDEQAKRYIYYDDQGEKRPVPVTIALAISLGTKVDLGSREALEKDMQSDAVRKHFKCPSQETALPGLTQKEDGPGWEAPREYSSYVFNEAVLGLREKASWRVDSPPVGKATKIKRPTVTMLAMDGRPRNQEKDDWLLVFDKGPAWTVYDFQRFVEQPNVGWGKELLDYTRHRYRVNVLFVDGHVEGVPMTEAGLKKVGVSMGVYQ